MQKGFTVVEILIVMMIIAVILAIAIPEIHNARVRAQAGAVVADARQVYQAFKQYHVDFSSYYSSVNLSTLDPLTSSGQYNGVMQRYLVGASLDGFDSPDDQGTDQEFWMEMTLLNDPTIRFLVSDSDNAPLSGGTYLDGIFKFENGVLVPI